MIPDISEAQWLSAPPRAPPRAFGTDWQGADWEFWEGIRPWSRVGEEWRDVERISVLATRWGINKTQPRINLRWSGMPLASLTCEISKMQVWMNIMFYYMQYSIGEEGVRSSKCSISLPGPSCAHESSGAVTSSRTLQTAGGSEKT